MLPNDPHARIAAHGSWTTCVNWTPREGPVPASFDTAEGFPSVAGLGDVLAVSSTLRRVAATLPPGTYRLIVTFSRAPGGDGLLVGAPDWQVEGEDGPMPIAEWFGVNIGAPPADLQAVINLLPGEEYRGSGGAGGSWHVRRSP